MERALSTFLYRFYEDFIIEFISINIDNIKNLIAQSKLKESQNKNQKLIFELDRGI